MNCESGRGAARFAATRALAQFAPPAESAARSRDRELAEDRLSVEASTPPARAPAIPPRWPRPQFRLRIQTARAPGDPPVPAARSRPPPLARTGRATGLAAGHRFLDHCVRASRR